MDEKVLSSIENLARKAQDSFEITMESLLTPDMRTIERAMESVEATMRLEKKVMLELIESEYPTMRGIISDFGRLSRYCSIIIEIALNRLLRKTSRICVITSQ